MIGSGFIKKKKLKDTWCKNWIWIGPNIGLGFSPISPNNEFVERGWKNWFYSRRKTIKFANLRLLNTSKIRKSVLGVTWGAYIILFCSSTTFYKSSQSYRQNCLISSLIPFSIHLLMLYTIILVSSLPYTCRLDSRNSFLSHPIPPRTIN